MPIFLNKLPATFNIHVLRYGTNQETFTCKSLSYFRENISILNGITATANYKGNVNSLSNLFHGFDSVLWRGVLQQRVNADQVNRNHVPSELFNRKLCPSRRITDDILHMHLNSL